MLFRSSLHKQKRHDEALERLQAAMKIDTQNLGKQHPNVARDAFAVGCVLALASASTVIPLMTQVYQDNYPVEQRGQLYSRAFIGGA